MLVSKLDAEKTLPTPLLVAYSVFLAVGFCLYHLVMSEDEDALSAILTVARMFQCLAIALLAAQVFFTGSVAGISARALGLHSLGLCLGLSSTLWLNGYLPVDESGDWFYQCVDMCALAMELWLLYQVLIVKRDSYQIEADSFPIKPLIVVCYVLAMVFHSDMNLRPLFDVNWMAGLFLGCIAVLPQLWLINRTGGKVEPLMSHNIMAMAVGTLLSGVFMYDAREDITCKPWIKDVNHAVLAILSAQILHVLLLGDFAYYYFKAVATQGLACHLDMENICNFV
jgi:ER lumen protein retaining receptor